MKLLKKIAPLAIIAMTAMLPLAGALNIANWKGTFTPSTTAVVVGSGTIGTDDMAAALTVAKAVGIDTTTPGSVSGGESYLFEKGTKKLTLADGSNDLTDIRGTITKDQLPTTLGDLTYSDDNNDEFDYTQKVTMTAGLVETLFSNKDYNNKVPTLGMILNKGDGVLTYAMDFSSSPNCGDDIKSTTFTIMGKDYYIIDADDHCATMSLLDSGQSVTLTEGDSKTVDGKTVSIGGVFQSGDAYEATVIVDGVETKALKIGNTYKLSDGTYIGIKDIRYSPKESGKSSVVISFGSGRIDLENAGHTVSINDETVKGLAVTIGETDDTWDGLTFTWTAPERSFVAGDSSITMPGLGGLTLLTTGMTFPASPETISAVADGTDAFDIDVPMTYGDAEIPFLSSTEGDGSWDQIGAAADDLLITSAGATVVLNMSANDNHFVVSRIEGSDVTTAESYYIEPTIDEDKDSNAYITLKDVAGTTTKTLCSEVKQGDHCEFGNIDLTVTAVNNDAQTATLTRGDASTHFDRIYSMKGADIVLPTNLSAQLEEDGTYILNVTEANKDGDLNAGESAFFTLGFDDSKEVSVTNVDGTALAGDGMLQTASGAKTYIGYLASDLGSKLDWDKSADMYTADMIYYGDQVYGSVYLAGAGTTTGSGTSWTAVKDSETSAFTGKNVIAIGGTAVNGVARKMLGLDVNTPVYGSDSAWATATGVDAIGKGILWIKPDVYTPGKYVMLVAGYEGADTAKTANFLTISGSTIATDKQVLDTTGTTAVEVTA